jgi:hypothetical protein
MHNDQGFVGVSIASEDPNSLVPICPDGLVLRVLVVATPRPGELTAVVARTACPRSGWLNRARHVG